MELKKAIDSRQSIRKYKQGEIPDADIRAIIEAAGKAPSGDNRQPWYFIAVKDPVLRNKIADAVEEKASRAAEIIAEGSGAEADRAGNAILKNSGEEELPKAATDSEKFMSFTRRFITFFRDAQVLIIVMSKRPAANFFAKAMMRTEKEQENFLGQLVYKLNPTMQSIGAALENLTLKAVELGYGTCWQTGPNAAWKEIGALLKETGIEKPDYDIAAFMPLGIPEDDQSSPGRKPVDEILTIL